MLEAGGENTGRADGGDHERVEHLVASSRRADERHRPPPCHATPEGRKTTRVEPRA